MKRFGVRDLASIAGVSVGTVDRALNGRSEISSKTRERILAVAKEYGYVPNLTARALSFAKSPLRIGLCLPREIHSFYDPLRQGVMDEVSRYSHTGTELLYRPIPKLSSHPAKAIRALLNEGIRALIFTPGLPRADLPLIAEAEQTADVRVVCVASDNSRSCRSSAVTVDPDVNGALAAELLAGMVPPASPVAVITGMLDTEEHRRKVESFQVAFPLQNGGRVVALIEGHEERKEVYEKTRTLIQQNKELKGIYVSTVICEPVCEAVEKQGLSGQVKVVGTDLFPELAPFFERRTLSATMYQNPYRQGQLAVRSILDHFLNDVPFQPAQYISPVIALRANLPTFREWAHVAGRS